MMKENGTKTCFKISLGYTEKGLIGIFPFGFNLTTFLYIGFDYFYSPLPL